jgi:hypothetical protein
LGKNIISLFFKGEILYFERDEKFKWVIHESFLNRILGKIEIEGFQKEIDFLEREVSEIKTRFWTRKGVIKLSYKYQNIELLDILDKVNFNNENLFFKEIEGILQNRLSQITENGSYQDIDEFLMILSKFMREKDKVESGAKGLFLDFLEEIIHGTRK